MRIAAQADPRPTRVRRPRRRARARALSLAPPGRHQTALSCLISNDSCPLFTLPRISCLLLNRINNKWQRKEKPVPKTLHSFACTTGSHHEQILILKKCFEFSTLTLNVIILQVNHRNTK